LLSDISFDWIGKIGDVSTYLGVRNCEGIMTRIILEEEDDLQGSGNTE